jgi:nucleotide-binding universal stress UspA family protein
LLIGLTVIDLTRLSYSFFITAPTYGLKELEEKKKEARQWLANIHELAKARNIRSRLEIIEDPISKVAAAIVNYAEHESVDLIVLGTRGKSGFKEILLGSVASDVIHYAHCPVMVVK